MKELKLNQCQDCGCQGAQLKIEYCDEDMMVVKCPYCGRKGVPFRVARGMAKYTPMTVAINSWNPYNRANEEGLA